MMEKQFPKKRSVQERIETVVSLFAQGVSRCWTILMAEVVSQELISH